MKTMADTKLLNNMQRYTTTKLCWLHIFEELHFSSTFFLELRLDVVHCSIP